MVRVRKKGETVSEELLSIVRPVRPISPAEIHRMLNWVTEQIAVSGDLPSGNEAKRAQLELWVQEGITDVIDVREERDDSRFIRENSDITPHWLGVDDCGNRRDDSWFENLVQIAREILADPNRRLLVHCHMGVNRGPSAAYAILLAIGWDHLNALRAIRNARPIAGIIYAPDAAEWFYRCELQNSERALEAREEVEQWLIRNQLDLYWVIASIGRRTAV